jgi:probable LLM family oxidoreductase
MELGLYTFAELRPVADGETPLSPRQRLRNLVEEIELADELGLDVFGVGEHHRADFAVSAPAIVLAAAAERTQSIRLTSAVTVLGADDPVRVFQDFATLDLLSGGRAEIMAGRGAFTEAFELFGCDVRDYDELFEDKIGLLVELRRSESVRWSGRHRPVLDGQRVFPRPLQQALPIWIAVGGSRESAVRAGHLGLPLALAVVGGDPQGLVAIVDASRRAARDAGHAPQPVSVNGLGFVAESSRRAADIAFRPFAAMMDRIRRRRGLPALTRVEFDEASGPRGAYLIGGPQEVAEKILAQHELFGHQRVLVQLSVGTVGHADLLRSIELFGTQVAPVVREEVARRNRPAA